MMFSQEYSQVIFGMGNVELFELKTSRIQCPSCLHYVFRGTIFWACDKHIRPDLDMMRRIKAAFGILKALHFRTSVLTSMGYKHGPNLWQAHPHRAKDALRGCSKSKSLFMSIWDRWQNDEIYTKSQLDIGWSDAWVRYLYHIAQIDIFHKASQEQRRRYHNLLYLRSDDEDRQTSPRSKERISPDAKAIATRFGNLIYAKKWKEALEWSTRSFTTRVPWVTKFKLDRVLRRRARTPNLIFLFSVIFNILEEHTLVTFELERMTSIHLAEWQVVRLKTIVSID